MHVYLVTVAALLRKSNPPFIRANPKIDIVSRVNAMPRANVNGLV
jgi:hypothetical protein